MLLFLNVTIVMPFQFSSCSHAFSSATHVVAGAAAKSSKMPRRSLWHGTTLVSPTLLLFGSKDDDFRKDKDDDVYDDQQRRRTLLRSSLSAVLPLVAAAFPSSMAHATPDSANALVASPSSPLTLSSSTVQDAEDDDNTDIGEHLTVPLKYIPSLSAYVVYYSVGTGGEKFGAIIDTGSPFLVVPSYCNRQRYGCYLPQHSRPAPGLADTLERFDNNEGNVEWRLAPFAFADASEGSRMMGPKEFVFGVLSESLMNGPGGVFMGLIRDTDPWIRPSFLGQTNVKAMEIDLRDNIMSNDFDNTDNNHPEKANKKTLTLYTKSPLQRGRQKNDDIDYIPLVRDLNRKYGDPVIHYTAKAVDVQANGNSIFANNNNKVKKKPIYVIFDTGVTGMVVSRELFDERYVMARQNKEKSLWGSVQITFQTHQGNTVSLSAQKPVTTPLGMKPWPKFNNAHLIVLGLAFLDGRKMLIDMDGQKLQLS